LVFEQFIHLNINVGHAGFYIDYKAHDDMHIWLADQTLILFMQSSLILTRQPGTVLEMPKPGGKTFSPTSWILEQK
jgi:hypothetical protein